MKFYAHRRDVVSCSVAASLPRTMKCSRAARLLAAAPGCSRTGKSWSVRSNAKVQLQLLLPDQFLYSLPPTFLAFNLRCSSFLDRDPTFAPSLPAQEPLGRLTHTDTCKALLRSTRYCMPSCDGAKIVIEDADKSMEAAMVNRDAFPESLRGKKVLLFSESLGPINGVSRTNTMLIQYLQRHGVEMKLVALGKTI